MDHIRLHVKYLDVSETKLTFTTNQTTFSVTVSLTENEVALCNQIIFVYVSSDL